MPKKQKEKVNLKQRVSNIFELPKEIVLNLPLVTIIGSQEMLIENYKGIIEYSEIKVRINTSCGVLKIEGKKLLINQMTKENLKITGKITAFEYLL